MPKARSKSPRSRTVSSSELSARASRSRASREVTAEEVIRSLLHLFRRLGIEVSRHRTPKTEANRRASHTLYRHAAAIDELLKSWHRRPEYLNDSGDPAPIRVRGPHPSFRALAQRGLRGLDESFLLAELQRLGTISIDRDNWLHVHMRYLPMYRDKRLAVQHTLATLQRFIGTLRRNLDSAPTTSEPLFHRSTRSGDFDLRELPALQLKLKRHGRNLLELFDGWLSRRTSRGSRPPSRRAGMTGVSLGIYLSLDTT